MTCREWLRNNAYEDVAALIDQAMVRMAARVSKQRRNWWDILSGGPNGQPRICEGIQFPVLRVAQIRQGVQVTPNAIRRNVGEQPPDVIATGRWQVKKKRTKNSPVANKQRGTDTNSHAKAS